MMILLRVTFKHDDRLHEWGFRVPSGYIPVVGDELWLNFEEPDTEPTGNNVFEAIVCKRTWPLIDEEPEVWLEVEPANQSKELEFEGLIADSTEWPSQQWSQRQNELRQFIKNLELDEQ